MSPRQFKSVLIQGIANLYPGYFAFVMATGIISIAAYLLEMPWAAWVLFGIAQVAFVVLWVLTLARLVYFFPRLLSDLTDHARGPGFFTLVAGTGVLGRDFVLLAGDKTVSLVLWFLAAVLWFVLMYTFFAATTVRDTKPTLENGLNGGWLLAVVATQSVSLLGTRLAAQLPAWQHPILFFTLILYLIGCALYLFITSLIFYRFMFFRLLADAITPPYWINMGAVAITTLSGATLISSAADWSILQDLQTFLKGFTLFFWSIGTWWIPLLVVLGAWRHLVKRFPLSYDPQYWGMVFPLGMYTVCTFELARVLQLDFLLIVPRCFIYVAILAWLATSAGLLRRIARILTSQ